MGGGGGGGDIHHTSSSSHEKGLMGQDWLMIRTCSYHHLPPQFKTLLPSLSDTTFHPAPVEPSQPPPYPTIALPIPPPTKTHPGPGCGGEEDIETTPVPIMWPSILFSVF
ncbi:unnamed protein product [Lota lota]